MPPPLVLWYQPAALLWPLPLTLALSVELAM